MILGSICKKNLCMIVAHIFRVLPDFYIKMLFLLSYM